MNKIKQIAGAIWELGYFMWILIENHISTYGNNLSS